MISSTSPARALASHTPAPTAILRSLQSRTPTDGALWMRWAPWRASRRAESWPITRQFPTATKSVRRPSGPPRDARSRARCAPAGSHSRRRRRSRAGARERGGRPRAAAPRGEARLRRLEDDDLVHRHIHRRRGGQRPLGSGLDDGRLDGGGRGRAATGRGLLRRLRFRGSAAAASVRARLCRAGSRLGTVFDVFFFFSTMVSGRAVQWWVMRWWEKPSRPAAYQIVRGDRAAAGSAPARQVQPLQRPTGEARAAGSRARRWPSRAHGQRCPRASEPFPPRETTTQRPQTGNARRLTGRSRRWSETHPRSPPRPPAAACALAR